MRVRSNELPVGLPECAISFGYSTRVSQLSIHASGVTRSELQAYVRKSWQTRTSSHETQGECETRQPIVRTAALSHMYTV